MELVYGRTENFHFWYLNRQRLKVYLCKNLGLAIEVVKCPVSPDQIFNNFLFGRFYWLIINFLNKAQNSLSSSRKILICLVRLFWASGKINIGKISMIWSVELAYKPIARHKFQNLNTTIYVVYLCQKWAFNSKVVKFAVSPDQIYNN
jgi:hypothetical protein